MAAVPVAPPQHRFAPGNYQGAVERPKPVLGAQPPLPSEAPVAVRYVQGDEDHDEKALVPTNSILGNLGLSQVSLSNSLPRFGHMVKYKTIN